MLWEWKCTASTFSVSISLPNLSEQYLQAKNMAKKIFKKKITLKKLELKGTGVGLDHVDPTSEGNRPKNLVSNP